MQHDATNELVAQPVAEGIGFRPGELSGEFADHRGLEQRTSRRSDRSSQMIGVDAEERCGQTAVDEVQLRAMGDLGGEVARPGGHLVVQVHRAEQVEVAAGGLERDPQIAGEFSRTSRPVVVRVQSSKNS